MKRFLAIVLILIGILTYLFFGNYSGHFLPYPALWFIMGMIFVIVGVRLFSISKSKSEKQLEESIQAEIDRLKHNGEKINVDFKDCEIISNNYYKEIPKSSNYKVQTWDSIYDNSRAVENIEINKSRIIYQYKKSNNDYTFISPLINKDKVTLSFILDKFKGTTIYVDKQDKSLYYFDLEFLSE